MGITTQQRLHGLAEQWADMEQRLSAHERALLAILRECNGCAKGCHEYLSHPTPWHAEKCVCAVEARERLSKCRSET